MGAAAAVREALDRMLAADPPRAGSLGVTIFGDVISQHGNRVWLGSLVRVMEEFGLNARQIRTALFRLVRDGWLETAQVGRRSYYAHTDHGRRLYTRAARRIYAADGGEWDGAWTLVTVSPVEPAVRDDLRRQLGWQGFGTLGGGWFAHPRADAVALADTLEELAVAPRVVVWHARAEAGVPLLALVRAGWPLDELADRYRAFLEHFAALPPLVGAAPLAPRDAFVLRVLLVHEYRRILLRTTDLPAALLPSDWPGHAAARFAASLYRAVAAPATAYARAAMENEAGALPAPDPGFDDRFGGYAPDPVARPGAHR